MSYKNDMSHIMFIIRTQWKDTWICYTHNDRGIQARIINKSDRVMYNSGNSVLGYKRNNNWQIRWAIESVNHGKYVTFRNIYRKNYM